MKEDSKSSKTKSAAEKRKSENETCTIMKKTKRMEEKRPAKEKKNENEICAGRTAKKYNIGYNSGYTENENPKTKLQKIRKK